MSSYEFKDGLYPSEIIYGHAFCVFQFFTDQEQSNEFLKYFLFRVEDEYNKRKKSKEKMIVSHVKYNHSGKGLKDLVDFNYNFFIEVMGDWIEHYSSNKNFVHEYSKVRTFYASDEDDKEGREKERKKNGAKKTRTYKINFSVKEKVQFDFSYSGWLVSYGYARRLRFILIKILFSDMLYGMTYVRNGNFPARAMLLTQYLLLDIKFDTPVKFTGITFRYGKIRKHLTAYQRKKFTEMNKEYEQIITTERAIKSRIEKGVVDGDKVVYPNKFNINLIEKERDEGSGKWEDYVEEVIVKNDDENDENDENDGDE